MSESKEVYHDLLEDTLIILRNHINKYNMSFDDIDLIKLCKLINEIERVV